LGYLALNVSRGSAPPDQATASAQPHQGIDFKQAQHLNPILVIWIAALSDGNSETVVRA